MVNVESQFTFGNVKVATHKTTPALPLARAQKSNHQSMTEDQNNENTKKALHTKKGRIHWGQARVARCTELDSYKNLRIGRFHPDAFGGFLPGLWARGPENPIFMQTTYRALEICQQIRKKNASSSSRLSWCVSDTNTRWEGDVPRSLQIHLKIRCARVMSWPDQQNSYSPRAVADELMNESFMSHPPLPRTSGEVWLESIVRLCSRMMSVSTTTNRI